MKGLSYTISLLNILQELGIINDSTGHEKIKIYGTDTKPIVEISEDNIKIGSLDFTSKIIPTKMSKLHEQISANNFAEFIKELSGKSKISLNHLGISYYCKDLDSEVKLLKNEFSKNEIYFEPAGDSRSTKWIFIGDASKPEKPMFEVVLNQRNKPTQSSWSPHFQIDLDTELDINNIKKLTSKHFKKDWAKWTLDIPDFGTVLTMGRIYSVGGFKVYLGLGTNLRNRTWHRQKELKPL